MKRHHLASTKSTTWYESSIDSRTNRFSRKRKRNKKRPRAEGSGRKTTDYNFATMTIPRDSSMRRIVQSSVAYRAHADGARTADIPDRKFFLSMSQSRIPRSSCHRNPRKEWFNDSQGRSPHRRPRRHEGLDRRFARDRRQPRAEPRRAREDSRLADQRLRQLHQHACGRGSQPGRDRATHLPAAGLARSALLHGTGAGGARLDRGAHPTLGRPWPRSR